MREILFRGKRLDNGEWAAGHYLTRRTNDHGLQHMISVQDMWGFHEVDPETVGQYTGIRDKNGTEIYEGDVVERKTKSINYSDSFNVANCEVFRNVQGAYRLRGERIYEMELYSDRNNVEVIGNRFEHPHLLKGEEA